MSSIIQKILRKLNNFTKRALLKYEEKRDKRKLSIANKYTFEENFSAYIYKEIKPITHEKIEMIPIFQVMPKGELTLSTAAQNCYRIKNAEIRSHADYIIVNGGKVIWAKKNLHLFTKDMPRDVGVVNYTEDSIYVQRHSLQVEEFDTVFSLCGVYSDVWSHFMLQYLVKLYNLLQIPKEVRCDITIMTPDYSDTHIKEAVNRFVYQYIPECRLATLQENVIARCKTLYWMDNTTDMIEHVSYVCPFDMITPGYVARQMQQYFIPQVEKKSEKEEVKLYITRHAQWRNMTNNDEVEAYFVSIGFKVIEAHKLDFDAKIRLFQSATEIVGPYSSGFANLVFCRPGTKVLIFSNIQRTLENFLAFYAQNFELDAMYITEKDHVPSDPDSPFSISLSRIQSAYKELINK